VLKRHEDLAPLWEAALLEGPEEAIKVALSQVAPGNDHDQEVVIRSFVAYLCGGRVDTARAKALFEYLRSGAADRLPVTGSELDALRQRRAQLEIEHEKEKLRNQTVSPLIEEYAALTDRVARKRAEAERLQEELNSLTASGSVS
jgi:hypothetical protein